MVSEKLKPTADQMDALISVIDTLAAGQSDEALDSTFQSMIDGTNTTKLFKQWWPLSDNQSDSKYERLCRFARLLSNAWSDKKYTLRNLVYSVSSGTDSSVMTPMDDLVGKSPAGLYTEKTATVTADWADEDPMTWYVRANALSLADGTMNVLAVEGVDNAFDITGQSAPVYTFSVALWIKEWTEGSYEYTSWSTYNHGGYYPYPCDVAPNNTKRDITWHPSFPGGLIASGDMAGGLTSGYGLKPYVRASASAGLTAARKTTAYEGLWNDADSKWVLKTWQLRHFNLENSGICEGCQSYNFTYPSVTSETGVKRIIIASANAANLQIGSCVSINGSGSDGRSGGLADLVRIVSIDPVTIDDTEYAAVTVDADTAFDTTTDAKISTMPWYSGDTERLPWHKDGACYSLTAGRNPLRVQGVEMISGAYDIGLDPLYSVTANETSGFDYAIYECKDSEKLSTSVTSDYVDSGISYSGMASGWNAVKKFFRTKKSVLFPEVVGGSTSYWYKSSFNGTNSAGVRCPWRYGYLRNVANAGLACGIGTSTPSNSDWHSRPRLCGSGKKRGEWAT